ncbi:MAG: hypothetical protein JO110_10215 [Acetobacteraceae bacterium]|nr:hypothetical protein [Acetobacteraceae bacterium]
MCWVIVNRITLSGPVPSSRVQRRADPELETSNAGWALCCPDAGEQSDEDTKAVAFYPSILSAAEMIEGDELPLPS